MIVNSEIVEIQTNRANPTPETYRTYIRGAALDDESLIQLTLKGATRGEAIRWRQIVVRPVQVRGERHLQFSYFDDRQDTTKNYRGDEAAARLDEVLALPFGSIHLRTRAGEWHIQITKKGKAILHRGRLSELPATADLAHDHAKHVPLPAGRPDTFLRAVGIMDESGKIRPAMHAKFAQVNAFLTLLAGELDATPFVHSRLHILDCGCGSAYLSFAAYHYLNDVRGIPARLTGIDTNGKLIEKDSAHAAELGYGDVCFTRSPIIDFDAETPIDILLALHACDTATDEAIALGIRGEVPLILVAPCCHHEMRDQLDQIGTVEPFAPMLRHGILRQRMAELLTDSFRALLLRMAGYRTDVVEFIAAEHTDKNLMIRAVKVESAGETNAAEEYAALKAFWGVTPYLEKLLHP